MQKPDLKLIAAIIAPLLVWPFVPAWDAGYLKDGDVRVLALFLLLPVAEEVVFRGFLQGWLLRMGGFKSESSWGSPPLRLPLVPARSTPVGTPLQRSDPSAVRGRAKPSPPLKWGKQASRAAAARTRGGWEGFWVDGFSARFGISGANLATSVAFALAHLWQHPALLFPGYFAVSLVLGYFRERYGGILVPVLLHSYYNLGLWVMAG